MLKLTFEGRRGVYQLKLYIWPLLATIVMAILKTLEVIGWSWWVVIAPTLFFILTLIFFVVIFAINELR